MKRKYKVTTVFADREIGDVTIAHVITADIGVRDGVLVIHPKSKGSCASIEFCVEKDGYLVSAGETWWANLEGPAITRLKKALK